MNIRAYTRANYHGVYIRWLSVTLANAFDWMRYQRRPLKFSWFELLGVRTCAYARAELYAGSMNCSAYARVYARTKYESSLMHICVGNLTIIGSDNVLSPGWRQAIIWTNAGILLTLGNKLQWNFNRNSYIFVQENAFQNVVWKKAAILSRPQCVNRQQVITWTDNN